MNRAATASSARRNKKPFLLTEEDLESMPPFPFPKLGSYCPEGWELVEELFCDSSGCGQPNEPALTVKQLLEKLEPGYGYAITREGQFQVYLGKFKKVDNDGSKRQG
jgi:hypothetical protein